MLNKLKDMLNKIKENEKLLELIMTIVFGVIATFYVIYKLSSSVFMVIAGLLIISFGYFMKDPSVKEDNKQRVEQLTIFSEEVLEPNIIAKNNKKVSKRVKA